MHQLLTEIDMYRNLDIGALRSFVTIAETGGVTRAAAKLNLTQSAVSMQIRRLETALEHPLLARAGRGVELTHHGEKLLSYGRNLLAINDEVLRRMTHEPIEGELVMGVPPDIIFPYITRVLITFNAIFPKIRINLIVGSTVKLLDDFANGQIDLALTTDIDGKNGEKLLTLPLKWYGSIDSKVCKTRPLPLAFDRQCRFRQMTLDALERSNIPWDMTNDNINYHGFMPFISADLAVTTALQGTAQPDWQEVPSGAGLPNLPHCSVYLYVTDGENSVLAHHLASVVRDEYTV